MILINTETTLYVIRTDTAYVNCEYWLSPYYIDVQKGDILPCYMIEQNAQASLMELVRKGIDISELYVIPISFRRNMMICNKYGYIPDYYD